jgi:hypothetical protein
METIKTHDLPATRLASRYGRSGLANGQQVSAALAVSNDSTIKGVPRGRREYYAFAGLVEISRRSLVGVCGESRGDCGEWLASPAQTA